MKRTLFLGLALTLAGASWTAPVAAEDADAALIARGAYLATAADCGACHTASGGKPFAGGLAIETPLGKIWSSNITPSKTAGIGGHDLAAFDRAVRHGVRADGANLYPAMPYSAYAGITDDDLKALYAYFMHGVEPVDAIPPKTDLPFPFSVRASMIGWNLLFGGTGPFVPDRTKSDEWNRGAYLAEALAHCSTCHTQRNALMAEIGSRALGGASLGTWYAPNITSDAVAGIGKWSAEDLAAYLATGRSHNGSQAGGPMLEVVDKSLSRLSKADVAALVSYIREVPPQSVGAAPGRLPASAPHFSDVALINGGASDGAMLYDMHCATCHQPSGEGTNGLPALFGNAALRRPVADNVAMAILSGLAPTKGQVMPAFASTLDSAKVATLTNHLFTTFGDAGVQITPARVDELRRGGAPSPLLLYARIGMLIAAVVGALVLLIVVRASRRRHR